MFAATHLTTILPASILILVCTAGLSPHGAGGPLALFPPLNCLTRHQLYCLPHPTVLPAVLQGFQYMELEANLTEEGTDVYGEYTPLTARDILVKDIDELKVGA